MEDSRGKPPLRFCSPGRAPAGVNTATTAAADLFREVRQNAEARSVFKAPPTADSMARVAEFRGFRLKIRSRKGSRHEMGFRRGRTPVAPLPRRDARQSRGQILH